MSEENPVKMESTCPNGHIFWEWDWVIDEMKAIKAKHGRGFLCPECWAPVRTIRPWESGCATVFCEESVEDSP